MSDLEHRFPRYSKLLKLFPSSYQHDYREQMLQTLADMLDDPARSKTSTWVQTSLDLPRSIVKENIQFVGGTMTQTIPSYARNSSLAGAALVAPFFIFAMLNAILHQRLYDSLFWQTWVLFIWLVVLPALAILINAVAIIRWAREQQHLSFGGLVRQVFDIKHTWPLTAVIVIALGIIALTFGHDSVHCIGGNPIQEAANWRQTLQCIQQR
ncbi:MAG TPA: hypothetical protein VFL85_02835 [Candidatus Saccharimonadales bacterium]|nr:hypothetical protein [Candidatus Saccharimonadales bacterium]